MDVKIDWLTFTVHMGDTWARSSVDQFYSACDAVKRGTNSILSFDYKDNCWELSPTGGFYQYRATHKINGITLKWGEVNEHVLLEFSGVGCEWLRSMGLLGNLLPIIQTRVSRLDIATDIETGTSPTTFVAAGVSKRILTRSSVTSPTGDTEYVGSRSGERMARVYRYNAPHPRAAFLRVEIEYKGEAAKALSALICRENLIIGSKAANKSFNWQHPEWKEEDMQVSKVKTARNEREAADTLRWLYNVVAPAIRRMSAEGLLDLYQFINQELFSLNGDLNEPPDIVDYVESITNL